MRYVEAIAFEGVCFELLENCRVEKSRYVLIGVEWDEGGTDGGVYFILIIPENKIVKDVVLVKGAHETHVVVIVVIFAHQF